MIVPKSLWNCLCKSKLIYQMTLKLTKSKQVGNGKTLTYGLKLMIIFYLLLKIRPLLNNIPNSWKDTKKLLKTIATKNSIS